MRINIHFSLIFTAAVILVNVNNHAQVSNSIASVEFGAALENNSVQVSAEMLPVTGIAKVQIAYRAFEESEFKINEMELIGNTAYFTIPSEAVKLPAITYYFIVTFTSGEYETYPLGIEQGENIPLELTVLATSPKDKEILILSPSPGELVDIKKLFLTISLIKASDGVDVSKTKIFLNNQDITDKCLFAGDVILFYGENFPDVVSLGQQSLRVELYDSEGKFYHSTISTFTSTKSSTLKLAETRFDYNGSIKAESRNQKFSGVSEWFNNIGIRASSKYEDFAARGYLYVTSEEKKYLQPQNRFSATVEYSDIAKVEGGDIYPVYPDLILSGKRVRGFNGEINSGYFNIQATFGETRRDVEGKLVETYSRETAPLSSNVIEIDSALYGQPYGKVELGTFSRQLFAIRPSFGTGRTFQLGFTYLHSKDDYNSIEFGSKPKENLVVGSDLKFAIDDQRIVFRGQAAVSLNNSDISTGDLTDEQIDSIFTGSGGSSLGDDAESFKDLKKLVSKFITFNQFIGPVNPEKLASAAGEAELQLNYFNNNLRASYIYRGNDYKSFGQDYVRTDVKGINISDRVRLMQNQLFLSLSYEKLLDNLQNTKYATTGYQTINTSVSYFPRTDFPGITVGYTRYDNQNDIEAGSINEAFMVDNYTNRFFTRLNYNFEWGVKHNSILNIATSSRIDDAINGTDAKYTSVSLNLNSYWTRDLSSNLYLITYNSEISAQPFNYTTIALGGRYKLLQDQLNVALNISPSFGDFERLSVELLSEYLVIQNLRLTFQFRYYNYPNISSDSVAGMILRWNF